jgi:hypothetical protein
MPIDSITQLEYNALPGWGSINDKRHRFWASGGGGFAGGDPNWRQTVVDGKLVTAKQVSPGEWMEIQESDEDGTEIATSVRTGVGSFHLGGVHSIGSAGQNVVFKNEFSNIAFFPLWQGQGTDGVTVINPSTRFFSDQVVGEPNAALQAAGTPVPYTVNLTLASNVSFTKVEVMPADTSATGGTWIVEFVTGNVEIARIAIPAWTAGTLVVIPFEYPLDIRAGDSIVTRIVRKDTGALMQARPGTTTPTAPWRRTTSRTFDDSEAINSSQHIHPDASGNGAGLCFDGWGKLQFGFGGNNLWTWDRPAQILSGRAGMGMQFDVGTTATRMYDLQYLIMTGVAQTVRLDVGDSSSRLMGPNGLHGFRAHDTGSSMVVAGSGSVRVGCTVTDAFLLSPNGNNRVNCSDTQTFMQLAGSVRIEVNSSNTNINSPGTTTVSGGTSFISLTSAAFGGNRSYTGSSDKRLKTDMQAIPDALLDVWEQHVKFGMYQFLDDLDTTHAGVYAQDIQDAFSAAGLDWQDYGIIRVDQNDRYMVSYNDVMVIEMALMRRKLSKL